ncbi:MAG: hypothetical protein AB7R90_14695 [Reyranellaceae bacterium]
MPVQYLLCRAALPLRAMRLLPGRTLSWPLRVQDDGGLRSRGLRLRLHGVGQAQNAPLLAARLALLLAAAPCRWRILAVDRDGTLAVLVRVGGGNVAERLLREGLVDLRGGGTQRLRGAQEQARRERRGLWRFAEAPAMRAAPSPGAPPFPWWQG